MLTKEMWNFSPWLQSLKLNVQITFDYTLVIKYLIDNMLRRKQMSYGIRKLYITFFFLISNIQFSLESWPFNQDSWMIFIKN